MRRTGGPRCRGGMKGLDGDADAATRRKLAVDPDAARGAGGDEVFQDSIYDLLVEAPHVAERGEVKLE